MQSGLEIDGLGTGRHESGQYIDPMKTGLLSGQCVVCLAWSGERVCKACLGLYARPKARCRRCGLGLASTQPVCGRCLSDPPPLAATLAAVDYAFPWEELLHRYKFYAALELEAALAGLLLKVVQAEAERPDLVLPLPMTDTHLRERGYNQSQLIARRIARALRLPCPDGLLLKMRDTARQSQLTLADREPNVRGVFAIEPLRLAEVVGRNVALVDDVMTSGATICEAARVLRAAGAKSVQAWVLARTPE